MSEQRNIVPFGKYKGQPVEIMAADQAYCEWLRGQPWFAEKFRDVYNIVINYGAEPDDTPEHNALQARFLEVSFCATISRIVVVELRDRDELRRRLSRRINSEKWRLNRNIKELDEYIEKCVRERRDEDYFRNERDDLEKSKDELCRLEGLSSKSESVSFIPDFYLKAAVFECGGWDISFKVYLVEEGLSISDDIRVLRVECKPCLGDDYPSVLRQMKGYRKHDSDYAILLVGSFSARGATLDQVRKIFDSSGIRLVMLDEVLAVMDSTP